MRDDGLWRGKAHPSSINSVVSREVQPTVIFRLQMYNTCMSRYFVLAILALIILIVGNVVEVHVYPERLGQVPNRFIALKNDGALTEKVRASAIRAKRRAEFWIIRDDQQKLRIAIRYIEEDAKRLSSLAQEANNPNAVTPQAGLLAESITRGGDVVEKAPTADIATFREDTKAAFKIAAGAVQQVKELKDAYASVNQQLSSVLAALEKHVGTIQVDEELAPSVAGTQDETAPTSTPKSTIPLDF